MNDIAIIRLENDIVYNPNILPVCLPEHQCGKQLYVCSGLYAVGWGVVNENGETATKLQNVKVRAYKKTVCGNNLNKTRICVGDVDNKKNTCAGKCFLTFFNYFFSQLFIIYVRKKGYLKKVQ